MRPPLDEPEFSRWREEADHALGGAAREAEAENHNWSCFLAEQAAQLAVKALLHGSGERPGATISRSSRARWGRRGWSFPPRSPLPPGCSRATTDNGGMTYRQSIGFTPAELAEARRRRNPLVVELDSIGIPVL